MFVTWLTDTLSKTSPMGSVIRAFDLQTGYQLCRGGSYNLARGLMERFIEFGGTFAPQCGVSKIVVEGGRAMGVELVDGQTVRARQFVASTLDVHTTFEDVVGRAQLPAAFQNFEYTGWTLFGLHLMRRLVSRLRVSTKNISRTLKWSIGAETMEDLVSAHDDVNAAAGDLTIAHQPKIREREHDVELPHRGPIVPPIAHRHPAAEGASAGRPHPTSEARR